MKALEILMEILQLQDMSYQVENKIKEVIQELMKPKNCEGCNHEEEKIKLFQYKCLPYPCRECVRQAPDRHEPKETL